MLRVGSAFALQCDLHSGGHNKQFTKSISIQCSNTTRSQAGNSLRRGIALDRTSNRLPPIVMNLTNRPPKILIRRPNTQLITTDDTKLFKWNIASTEKLYRLRGLIRRNRSDDARLR